MNAAAKYGLGAVIVALVLFTMWRVFAPDAVSLGSIAISSPEVFTRERLVNDRYEQDSWLKDELKKDYSCHLSGTAQESRTRQAAAQVGEHPAGEPSTPPAVSPQSELPPSPAASASDMDCFEQAMDYRDQLRSQRIENQLDDRHDLNGASLFRLKFDIAVVPGRNTTAVARVEVKVGPVNRGFRPFRDGADDNGAAGSEQSCTRPVAADTSKSPPSDMKAWEPIYHDWIDSVDMRLNQTQHEQLLRYTNNSLARTDYFALIKYLVNRYDVREYDRITSCQAALSSRGQITPNKPNRLEDDGIPLTPHDHDTLRACMGAIVTIGVPDISYTGAYGDTDHPERTPRSDWAKARKKALERYAASTLSRELDGYFASKTVRLVLGIDVPPMVNQEESAFATSNATAMNLLQTFSDPSAGAPKSSPFYRLLKLSYFHHLDITNVTDPNQDSFSVEPSVKKVVAIDKNIITPERLEEILKAVVASERKPKIVGNKVQAPPGSELWGYDYDDFSLPHTIIVSGTARLVYVSEANFNDTRIGLGRAVEEQSEYPFTWTEFKATDEPGVYVAEAQTGLYTFAQALRNHGSAFAYAVSPQEHGVLIRSTLSGEERMRAAMGVPIAGSAETAAMAGSQRSAQSEQVTSRAEIIGFGENVSGNQERSNCEGQASFGWIINPNDMNARSGVLSFRQAPRKYTVSAEVSVPSWWRSALITTTTSWLTDGGRDLEPVSHVDPIEIPSDFEAFEETLLGSQGPELDDSALDAIQLKVMDDPKHPQYIVIPGRRLWRSAQVTLGYQQASSISVLPNMKGIIARFDSVPDMSTPDEEWDWCGRFPGVTDLEIARPVRVWTSQGAVTLPRPAKIYVLGKCKDNGVSKHGT